MTGSESLTHIADDLRTLQARLARLEDERDILRTIYTYSHAVDYGAEEDFVDCFTVAGTFEVHGRTPDYPDLHLTGRAELASFANRHTRPPAAYHKHLVAEPIIELDRDQAKCTSYFAVLVEDDDGVPRLRNFGLYRDHLVRDADGIWRIHKRAVDVEVLRPGLESMRGPTDR